MGVDTVGWKVRAFVISAAFAGLAGALLVHKIQLVTPRMFTFVKSMEVVVMVVLGGMGSITGSIVAATLLTVALESLQAADQYRMVIFSLLLIVLMLTRPSGLLGTRELWESVPRLLRRRQGGEQGLDLGPGRRREAQQAHVLASCIGPALRAATDALQPAVQRRGGAAARNDQRLGVQV